MPTYLIHGFRWPRPLIRIHIILQNLDDAAAEWLLAPATTRTLLANFRTIYDDIMPALPNLRFVEQYDPSDVSSKSQPFAYVADIVHEIPLGVDVDDIRGKGLDTEAWGSLMELRDKIAPGEKVSWFVVVCGDTERWAPPTVGLLEGSNSMGSAESAVSRVSRGSMSGVSASSIPRHSNDMSNGAASPPPRGLRKWFSRSSLRRSRSMKSLNGQSSPQYPSTPVPPVPSLPRPGKVA